jgi:hypothetical protein
MGLMALNKPTPSAVPVVAASQKERVAKPIKQATVAQKDAQPQKRKVAHVARKRKEEAPTNPSGFDAYASSTRRQDSRSAAKDRDQVSDNRASELKAVA